MEKIQVKLYKEFIKEAEVASDYIVTSVQASTIPGQYIPKADVGLGLHMGNVLGRGLALSVKDYSLEYLRDSIALKLTSSGKTAVRVRTQKIPDYVDNIKEVADKYLSNYANKIKNR